jgi:hypothetical protein
MMAAIIQMHMKLDPSQPIAPLNTQVQVPTGLHTTVYALAVTSSI